VSFSRPLPDEVRAQDKIIGLFVLVAMGLVLYLVLQQTYFQSQKTDWLRLNAVLNNSFGLNQGTLIELSGVTIGNVESVVLRPDAQVEVTVLFDNEYAGLLSVDSKLKVNSRLGLDTVLSGVRLELVPGKAEQKLANNASIHIMEPKSLDQVMEEMKLEELARQLQAIIGNVEKLTSDLAGRRGDIAVAMENMGEFSGQMVRIGALAPDVLANADATMRALQDSLRKLNRTVDTLLSPTSELMASTSKVMAATHETLKSLQPSLQQMPELLATTNEAMLSVNQISHQLSHHWLLGGDDEGGGREAGLYRGRLPADDELYNTNTK